MARNVGFASFRWMSSVRDASGANWNSARCAEAKACPRTRSLISGRGSATALRNPSTGPGPTGPIWMGMRSMLSMMWSMSSSHHHGQQNHQFGQHGQQNRQIPQVHQLKQALKNPFASAFTVTRGDLLYPPTMCETVFTVTWAPGTGHPLGPMTVPLTQYWRHHRHQIWKTASLRTNFSVASCRLSALASSSRFTGTRCSCGTCDRCPDMPAGPMTASSGRLLSSLARSRETSTRKVPSGPRSFFARMSEPRTM